MTEKPFIARDTKEPLEVLGGYKLGEDGDIIRETISAKDGTDYGCDPLPDGKYRMVPSGDIVDYAERCRRLDK